MILWTIQPYQAWEHLQEAKHLRPARQFIDQHVLPAYEWMVSQMEKRIGRRPTSTAFPLWAWYQADGACRRRPDLRHGGHLPPGTRGIRLEFEIAGDLVLLSDFELWHYALNYWYLPESLADGTRFEQQLTRQGLSYHHEKPLAHPTYHHAIEESWMRMFDLEWDAPDITCPKPQKCIQTTCWELHLAQVKETKEFVAR